MSIAAGFAENGNPTKPLKRNILKKMELGANVSCLSTGLTVVGPLCLVRCRDHSFNTIRVGYGSNLVMEFTEGERFIIGAKKRTTPPPPNTIFIDAN